MQRMMVLPHPIPDSDQSRLWRAASRVAQVHITPKLDLLGSIRRYEEGHGMFLRAQSRLNLLMFVGK